MPEHDDRDGLDVPEPPEPADIQAPADAPRDWWREIQLQARVGLAGLVAEIPLLAWLGIGEAATMPLVIVNLGLLATILHYGGGTAAIDLMRAWRGQ